MNWKNMKLHDGNYLNGRRMYDRSKLPTTFVACRSADVQRGGRGELKEKWRSHAAGLSLFGSVSELMQLALKALIYIFFVERLEENSSLSC